MIDQPDGAQLLAEARRVLLETLLPELPEKQRFNALMVANAMAIARRELEASGAQAPESDSRGMVAEIRERRRDGDPGLHQSLLKEVENRVLLSNPSRLDDN
ncbi:MAG: DUF6285 domain-containing protein [Pseudomonadota bacterium]